MTVIFGKVIGPYYGAFLSGVEFTEVRGRGEIEKRMTLEIFFKQENYMQILPQNMIVPIGLSFHSVVYTLQAHYFLRRTLVFLYKHRNVSLLAILFRRPGMEIRRVRQKQNLIKVPSLLELQQ